MKEYQVIRLENDMEFTQFFLDHYPKIDTPQIRFTFFNDTRIGDKRDEIENMLIKASKDNPNFDSSRYNIVGFDEAFNFCSNHLDYRPMAVQYIKSYVMSLKLLMAIYMLRNVDQTYLYQDDDAFIMRDPTHLFGKYPRTTYHKDLFVAYKPAQWKEFKELCEVFELDSITMEEYNVGRVKGSPYMLVDQDPLILERYINQFFNSEYLQEGWINRPMRKYSTPFFAEMRFWNFFRIGEGSESMRFKAEDTMQGTVGLIKKDQKSFTKIKTLYEYGVGKHKHDWIKRFDEIEIRDDEWLKKYRGE